MPQTVLMDKPVILSKYKGNVITHGKPLGPMGSLRSFSPYVPRPDIKGSFIQEKHGDTVSNTSPLQVRSESFSEYQKSAHENLISINNNLSSMLQETFSGIDSICQKVRMCLMEANTIKPSGTISTLSRMEACEEETHSAEVLSIEQVEQSEQDQIEAELIDENDVEDDEETNENDNKSTENRIPKNIPNITPFVTILDPQKQSAESIGITLINSIQSKLGLVRKCTVENFQTTVKKAENQLINYEKLLKCMAKDVGKARKNGEGKVKRQHMPKRPKSSPSDRRFRTSPDQIGHYYKKQDFTEEPLSEHDLWGKDSIVNRKKHFNLLSSGKADYLSVDVYRKRAITDLHKRMVAQVEANDSLIFFQKLMAKNKKHIEEIRPATAGESCTERSSFKSPMQSIQPQKIQGEKRRRSLTDLSKKYKDSLWFRHKHESKRVKKEPKKSAKQSKQPSKKEKCLPQSFTIQSTINPRGKLLQQRKSSKESTASSHGKNTVNSVHSSCKCKISITNNQPLSTSDKCRLHWMRAKYSQLSHKKLKYLDILDDISNKDLVPIRAEYPRRDGILRISNVKDSYLYKLMNGKDKDTKKAWTELLEPSKESTKGNGNKCVTWKSVEEEKTVEEEQKQHGGDDGDNRAETIQSNEEKQMVIRTLSKYIFAESSPPEIQNHVYTVMPVHVFYDSSRIPSSDRKIDALKPQKLPLLPMKECKEGKKAEWTSDNAKKPKRKRNN